MDSESSVALVVGILFGYIIVGPILGSVVISWLQRRRKHPKE